MDQKKIFDSYDCSDNELKLLKGCPKIINGNFICSGNKLKSLKYDQNKLVVNLSVQKII